MADVDRGVAAVPISIVIADDHAMIRRGLRMLLDAEPDLVVVAEASDVDEALQCAQDHSPAVVVLDLRMPGRPTIAAIPDFRATVPDTAIVVLTMYDDPAFVRDALRMGASGYVLKEAAETELVAAVRATATGSTYLNPRLGALLAASQPEAPAPAAPDDGAAEIGIGSTFAGHRIDALVGRGGMGVVYRATDLTLDRSVALKLIAPALARDPVFRARFEQECRLAASIDHPQVVQIFHAGAERGVLYVTMRYVEGTDLRTLLSHETRLAPVRAVSIVGQVADGLHEAHRLGLVHRDVKPANVLVATKGGRERAYLTDFGLTRQRETDAGLTATGFAIGTADYMAPEQARGGQVDAGADIYALGCVLYRALTGEVPYARDSDLEKMWAHVHDPPPHVLTVCPELPERLAYAVERALAKEPRDRQLSAAELAHELRSAVA